MPTISLQNLSYAYGYTSILNDFSLDIASSQLTCLLGSSGCGKTTLLRLIAGLEIPQKGQVLIGNKLVAEHGKILIPAHKRKIGFVFQDLALWPHFNVYNNIGFALSESKKYDAETSRNKIEEVLQLFDLQSHRNNYPHQLSGGQKQLVAIARALVMEPDILLMDEPLANLDVKRKRNILDYIKQIQKQYDLTLVYVTHDQREAFSIADRVVVMDEGKIVAQGSVTEIKKSNNTFVQDFLAY